MSAWVSAEAMKWALRSYSRRSPWTQRSLLATASVKDTSFPRQVAHVWGPRQSQACLARTPVSPVRFYSQDSVQGEASEETPQSAEATSERKQGGRPFEDRLQACRSPSDVLDLTYQYTPAVWQVSSCLNQMWITAKKLSDEQRHYELQLMVEHPAFELLLQRISEVLKHMSFEDISYSLLYMVRLGVPQQSRVIQTLLRICQERLNNFDEKSLSILASALEYMNSCPSVSGLKAGMRLVVDVRLPSIKSVLTLQTMMRLLGKDAPRQLKRKLEIKGLSMTDQFSLRNTQHMISTMAKMDFYSKPLLDACSQKIIEGVHGVPFNRLLTLLYACKNLHYKNFEMLTGVSEYIASVQDILTNKQLVLFLSVFENLSFCPDALMEAFAKKVIASSDTLKLKDVLLVLKVYSSLNYDLQQHRQQFLDSVTQVLLSYLPKMSGFELLKSVYYLCQLGHFPSAPLEQLLESSTIEQFNITTSASLPRQEDMLRKVDLCLRLDRPPLPRPLTVPQSVLVDSSLANTSVNASFLQALQSVMEDQVDTVLQEMVTVENFYLIDAVITKPPPNQTSVTDTSSCAGDELPPAGSSQRIAVICAPFSGFCYGMSKPRGALALKIRHLKILGYDPVLVPEHELQYVPEGERTQFLRGRIFPEQLGSDVQPEDVSVVWTHSP